MSIDKPITRLLRFIVALPFLYSAAVKFRDFDYFLMQVGVSPIVPEYVKNISFILPVFDASVFIFLMVSSSKRPLIFSLALYVFYTVFLFSVLFYAWLIVSL